jgi:uncharacterized protein YjbJ (UPF0337 family)
MSEHSLHILEQDVESARTKLISDLSRLRSPATYAEFTAELKEEVVDAKDVLVEKAKAGVRSTIEEYVETLKAKAAANPTAALAIGAGIAWRLFQRPPIATALIGAGLVGLLRTTPAHTNGQTGDYLEHAKERLKEQASDFAGRVKEEAGTVVDTVTDKASEFAGVAKERLGQLGDQTLETAQRAASNARATASHSMERGSTIADELSGSLQNVIGDQEARDKVLLGLAGAAVVAALGIAYQRRSNADS